MLGEERHKQILEIVRKNGSASVQELSEALAISDSTIRRDLAELDDEGRLQKVHGGAVARNIIFADRDIEVNRRMSQNREAKLKIAKYAASLVCDNDFVYIDAGTTTEMTIDFITAKNAVFVTNGFSHARILSAHGFKTFIIGGEIKFPTEAVIGASAVLALEKYNFSLGFFGTNGISVSKGYSTPDVREALVKEMAMKHCEKKYVLADSSKFNQVAWAKFGEFDDAKIITEKIEDYYVGYENILEAD